MSERLFMSFPPSLLSDTSVIWLNSEHNFGSAYLSGEHLVFCTLSLPSTLAEIFLGPANLQFLLSLYSAEFQRNLHFRSVA